MAYFKSDVDNYYIIDRLIKYKVDKGDYRIKIGWDNICICIKFVSEIDRNDCYKLFETLIFNSKWIDKDLINYSIKEYNGYKVSLLEK